ncbi:hypothetical protein [Yinghuangia soli]|uniref:Secreted protein n=1 Tax=Yinghuangia soli TaxID=2908204 RepID=A0AA41Q9G2_9ACTN|nr:hypothetical protein [Yinghuangia soli]MCF2533375.1 hypothetical protein [Yinghuangia soli]
MHVLVRRSAALAVVAALAAVPPAFAAGSPGSPGGSAPAAAPVASSGWTATEIRPGGMILDLAGDGLGGMFGAGYGPDRFGDAPTAFGRSGAGGAWQQTAFPTASGDWSSLVGVAALSPGRALAVGGYDADLGGYLVVGTGDGKWQQLRAAPAPPGTELGSLNSIDALGPADAWAVGESNVPSPNGTYDTAPVAEHWDGSAWTIAPLPQLDPEIAVGVQLTDVEMIATDDVWASGATFDGQQPVLAHYDGTGWEWVLLPYDDKRTRLLVNSLEARAADDVWAAGWQFDAETGAARPLLYHYDGRSWSPQSTPAGVQRLTDLTLTPGGFAATTREGGTYGVIRYAGGVWTRLVLPQTGPAAPQATALEYVDGTLSVAARRPDTPEHVMTVEYRTQLNP